MTVTVWHATDPREHWRTYTGVERVVDLALPDTISLYGRDEGGDFLIASFGPGKCWAIDTTEEAA